MGPVGEEQLPHPRAAATDQCAARRGCREYPESWQQDKTNLRNEMDITSSSRHISTTNNPGLKGQLNSSVDILDANGRIKTRRWFGSDGNQIRDVDFTNHGNPEVHPEWPHEHRER
jgi:hypothetical protein